MTKLQVVSQGLQLSLHVGRARGHFAFLSLLVDGPGAGVALNGALVKGPKVFGLTRGSLEKYGKIVEILPIWDKDGPPTRTREQEKVAEADAKQHKTHSIVKT